VTFEKKQININSLWCLLPCNYGSEVQIINLA